MCLQYFYSLTTFRLPACECHIKFTSGSRYSSSFAIGESVEGNDLKLVQADNSARTSELNGRAEIKSPRLLFDIERETRHRELEQTRVEVEARR
jgi:hypothetical protein